MTPTVQLYVIRIVLGIIAAAISAVFATFMPLYDISTLINSITVALLVYFITYYILKAKFKDKIVQQSKILSTGIGMYFFSWIFFFVFIYTAIQLLSL
ncbi:MAG: hypothetical protein ACQCN4_04590 [Candidatus Bathyarchaeia archaeon]|jgi:hypothetical protein